MDRCALFVDAGYVLADGAMAVHGTRHRESVSWNYAGLLQFLGSVASDRTGLPLLRCYWYEATVEGRRSAEHDALADLPGVKLRLGRMRPGRREGVESEIHRDLTTLARNGALQDALVVSAEEDLAQVIADVQDLGLRVTLVHITVDGNWTISRALRQECDDIVEIGEAHLRPYVELVVGAEPLRDDERHGVSAYPGRALTNGHGPVGPLGPQQALPAGSNPAPPEIYTAPVIAEYQRTAQPGMNGQPGAQQPAHPSGPIGMAPSERQAPQPGRAQNAPPAPAGDVPPGAGVMPGMQQPAGMAAQPAAPPRPPAMPAGQPAPAQAQAAQTSGPIPVQAGMPQPAAGPGMAGQPGPQQQPAGQQPMPAPRQRRGRKAAAGQDPASMPPVAHPGQQPAAQAPMGQQVPGQQVAPGQQVMPGPQAVPGQQPVPVQQAAPGPQAVPGQQPAAQAMPAQAMPAQAMPGQQMPGPPGMQGPPVQPGHPGMGPPQGAPQVPQAPPGMQAEQPIYPAPPAYQGPVPEAMNGPGGGPGGPPEPGGPAGPAAPQGRGGARAPAATTGRFTRGPQNQHVAQAQQYPGPPADQPEAVPGAPYLPERQGMYAGPQPTASHLVPQQTSVSLADAVQAAHGEGFS
ncbi:MAG TPA: NYN domain-containing protein, partial [Streptosporangiaceae bacterium]|nr:NYN domain-containing protein [Streptosporangiaceae bacterium]